MTIYERYRLAELPGSLPSSLANRLLGNNPASAHKQKSGARAAEKDMVARAPDTRAAGAGAPRI